MVGYLQKDYQGVIDALARGALKPHKMITGKIRIDRVVEDGFRPLTEDKGRHVKILVDMAA